jgi:RNA methyltransferase, TrmH family
VSRSRPPRPIDSRDNPAVRDARRLERDGKARRASGLFVAWGLHLAAEAVATGAAVTRVFLARRPSADGEAGRLAAVLAERGAERLLVPAALLESIAAGSGDQGILLIVRRPRADLSDLLAARPTLLLAVHGVQDPGNVGTMARSALVLGAGGLVALEGTADLHSGRAVRAGMGAQFALPMADSETGPAIAAFRGAGLRIVAADLRTTRPLHDIDLTAPSVLCVGNEGAGLPEALLAAADSRARIPMAREGASLNVQAAATVLLYEAGRQRGFPPSDRRAPPGPTTERV